MPACCLLLRSPSSTVCCVEKQKQTRFFRRCTGRIRNVTTQITKEEARKKSGSGVRWCGVFRDLLCYQVCSTPGLLSSACFEWGLRVHSIHFRMPRNVTLHNNSKWKGENKGRAVTHFTLLPFERYNEKHVSVCFSVHFDVYVLLSHTQMVPIVPGFGFSNGSFNSDVCPS